MIKLMVQDYCQECPAFDPAAYEGLERDENGDDRKVIEVRCSRWELCANVARRTRKVTIDDACSTVKKIGNALVEMRHEA